MANPFYNDTSILCARCSIRSKRVTRSSTNWRSEGGALWPFDLTEEDRREVVARRRAMQRLTGTLFAPAVPNRFLLDAAAFRASHPRECVAISCQRTLM